MRDLHCRKRCGFLHFLRRPSSYGRMDGLSKSPGAFRNRSIFPFFLATLMLMSGNARSQADSSEPLPVDTLPALAGSAEFSDMDVPFDPPPPVVSPVLSRPSRLSERVRAHDRAVRKSESKVPKTKRKKSGQGIRPGMVAIQAGCFQMGSAGDAGPENEHPRHEVCLSAFMIDRLPVQEAEFEKATGNAPWALCSGAVCSNPNPDLPAWYVTWSEADSFCRSKGGRLPTEAEFEYAARAGDSGEYIWGDTLAQACDYANFADLSLLDMLPGWAAFPCKDGNALIATAGGRKPNRWGLYDMAGNVWQWTADWYAEDWYSKSPKQDPKGPAEGTGKVMRGGSWLNGPTGARVAYRDGFHPDERYSGAIGFRCAYPAQQNSSNP